jgi:hypothetical protein
METIKISGKIYYIDISSNGLYSIEANGAIGHWVGFYQPANKANKIHYTAHPGGGSRTRRKSLKLLKNIRNKRKSKRKNTKLISLKR